MEAVDFKQRMRVDGVGFMFFNAGHVLGKLTCVLFYVLPCFFVIFYSGVGCGLRSGLCSFNSLHVVHFLAILLTCN